MNTPPTNPAANLNRYVVMFCNDLPPATLFTDDREIRLDTLSTANVLATDSFEAVALATKATVADDLRPLAALTAEDLKALIEGLERSPFTDACRVDYSRSGPTAAEIMEIAKVNRTEDAPGS